MTTTHNLIILAAGRGSRIGRIGDTLHKALLPLGNKAIISRQIALAPANSNIIIVVGYLAEQVIEFVGLAHPDLNPTFIYIDDWEDKGGPGRSLLEGLKSTMLDKSLPTIFVTCDTLWDSGTEYVWSMKESWAAVSPMPLGSIPSRWMRFNVPDSHVTSVLDKTSEHSEITKVWTGLGMIAADDLYVAKAALANGGKKTEQSIAPMFYALQDKKMLAAVDIGWLDVGDESAYREAIIETSGYDWAKIGQATYLMPETGRVVKFFEDQSIIVERIERSKQLGNAVPKITGFGETMIATEWVDGKTGYELIDDGEDPYEVVAAAFRIRDESNLHQFVSVHHVLQRIAAKKFYRDKTIARIEMLRPELRHKLVGVIERVPWEDLSNTVVPVIFHGDFTLANTIYDTEFGALTAKAIDYRERFTNSSWGDIQYDLAKMLSSGLVNWHNASRGRFEPWEHATATYDAILSSITRVPWFDTKNIQILAALCLINSAPLHASPFDEVLVTLGVKELGKYI